MNPFRYIREWHRRRRLGKFGTVKMTPEVMRQLAEQQKHKGEPMKPERFLLETPYDLPDGSPVTEINYFKSDTVWRLRPEDEKHVLRATVEEFSRGYAVDGDGNAYTREIGGQWVKEPKP